MKKIILTIVAACVLSFVFGIVAAIVRTLFGIDVDFNAGWIAGCLFVVVVDAIRSK